MALLERIQKGAYRLVENEYLDRTTMLKAQPRSTSKFFRDQNILDQFARCALNDDEHTLELIFFSFHFT